MCEIIRGAIPPKVSQGSIPVYNGGVVANEYVGRSNTQEGTIVVSAIGSTCGFVNRPHSRFWLGNNAYGLVPGIDSRYFYYCLKASQDNLIALRAGSGQPYIPRESLFSLVINISGSIREQRRIATSLSSIDANISSLQSLIAKYEAIKKATVNLLMKPKKGWDRIRLGDFEPRRNNTCSRSLTSSAAGKVRNIHYGDILVKYGEIVSLEFDQVDYLSEVGEAHAPTDYLQDGDIVIADTAEDETAGKVVEVQDVANRKVVAGLHTVFLRPPTDLFARGWLGYWMNSKYYHDQLLPYMTGIKVLSLSKSSLANTEIYYPARTLQERRVKTLESIDTHIAALHSQVDIARQLKQGMMTYFFG